MKILITGGSGLLGSNLALFLAKNYNVVATYNKHKINTKKFNCVELNLEKYKDIKNFLFDYKPNIIIHSAAVSRPEIAENMSDDELKRINIDACEYIADISNKIEARIFFTSTDLVYEESENELFEFSRLNPKSKYAKSKLEAEKVISNIAKNYVILRVALLLGFSYGSEISSNFHKNYIAFMNNQKANLYIDQIRTPLSVIEAGRILEKMFSYDIKNDIVNFCGKDFVTRYQIGEILCKSLGKPSNLLNPIELSKLNINNKIFSLKLNSDKLDQIYKNRLDIEKSIDELVKNYEKNNINNCID